MDNVLPDIMAVDHRDVTLQRRSAAWKELLQVPGVVETGHFLHKGSLHSRFRFNAHPIFAEGVAIRFLSDLVAAVPYSVRTETTIVAGPQTAGLLMVCMVASLIASEGDVSRKVGVIPIVHKVHRVGLGVEVRRYSILEPYASKARGAKVLLVDDVRFTGGTFAKCSRILTDLGAEVLATASLIDADVTRPKGHYSTWPLQLDSDVWPAATCPMCKEGVALS